ncbi:hypothetical protein BDV09DRAFT_200227 [Aspergillus tetrazonus]
MALPTLSNILVRCDLNNKNIQNCLVDLFSHPQVDPNLTHSHLRRRPLHFATAHHDPELLTWLAGLIPGGLAAAGTTALGHTLLHIASLPPTASQIVAKNPNLARSIHWARTLDYRWRPWRLPMPAERDFDTLQQIGSRNPQPLTVAQQQAQLATIEVLLQ